MAIALQHMSLSSRRAWIEISRLLGYLLHILSSLSSRRAWIEIKKKCAGQPIKTVALLAEGVDRNEIYQTLYCAASGRSPRGGRG